MKLKAVKSLEENELFFFQAITSDGLELRSYVKCKIDLSSDVTNYLCKCTNGDDYCDHTFHMNTMVWA